MRKIKEEELEEIAEEIFENPNTVYICFEDDEYYSFTSTSNCVGEHILFEISPYCYQDSTLEEIKEDILWKLEDKIRI